MAVQHCRSCILASAFLALQLPLLDLLDSFLDVAQVPMIYIHVPSIATVGFGRIGDSAGRVSDVGEVFQRPDSWMRFLKSLHVLCDLDSIRLELI
jgi:hypothetical protein